MKFLTLLLTAISTIGLVAFTNPTTPVETFQVDAKSSTVTWTGYKVTGSHTGFVYLKNGTLDYQDGKLMGGEFNINMTSLECTDLEGGTKAKLEGHLKSDDFFGVENHPTAHFKISNVNTSGDNTYRVRGDLTIKEKTQPIEFTTTVTEEGGVLIATADISVDRSEFDVRYGSGSFFDNLGDKTIYDDFNLQVRLVTAK